MNKMECMIAAYLHEEPEIVPQGFSWFDDEAQRKFVPDLSSVGDPRRRVLRYAEYMDDFVIGCGGGGFSSRVVESTDEYTVTESEVGTLTKIYRMGSGHRATWQPAPGSERLGIRTLHNWTEVLRYPVEEKEDLDSLELPDPDDPSRYEGVEENVRYFTGQGYLATGGIMGFFSGVWYNLCPFSLWLSSLARDRRFARSLVDRIGDFNYRAAKNLLESGVQCITWPDDLGYRERMFISPSTYEEVIYPWHRRVAELAHRHGGFAEMHVDGNINAIMGLLVDAGLDAINNVGPGDKMDLATLKERYGDRVTLHGGLSRFTGEMTKEELRQHLIDRLNIGSPGGGYILGHEGGITSAMSVENFNFMMELSRRFRRNPRRLA